MDAPLPFPVSPVSNGEWCPPPVTRRQRLAARLIAEESARHARRLGLTRAEFLCTAAGTATAFMVLNLVHGLDCSGDAAVLPVKREQCENPAAGRALLDRRYFVMDVQNHHVDLNLSHPEVFCFLRFRPSALPCPQSLGQLNFVKEVFVDSETDVGVVSGVPQGVLLPPQTMADTRDLVNRLAGSRRALSQAVIDARNPPGTPTSVDSLEHQVRDLGAVALKCYTYSGNWWLDDEQVSYPMLAEARRLGLTLINVHKGLPNTLFPGSAEYVRTRDFPKVVRDWPDLRFCAYHSGYFLDGSEHSEFISILEGMDRASRRRVYAEIGSSFAITFLAGPDRAAHFIGRLLKVLGSRNILWGTDAIWWGSPQWLIDAFKALQIPPAMQEEFGYPPLTAKAKRRILGLNAAHLYGVKPREPRCTVPPDAIDQLREAKGGVRVARSLRVYGPRTRREFLAFWRREGGAGG